MENVDNFIKNLDNAHYMVFESFFVCLFVLWITLWITFKTALLVIYFVIDTFEPYLFDFIVIYLYKSL